MQIYTIQYKENARKELKKLPKTTAKRIIEKLNHFTNQENPLIFAKPLTNLGERRYRFRIGEYRAIFKLEASGEIKIIMILKISHRKNIYEKFM